MLLPFYSQQAEEAILPLLRGWGVSDGLVETPTIDFWPFWSAGFLEYLSDVLLCTDTDEADPWLEIS